MDWNPKPLDIRDVTVHRRGKVAPGADPLPGQSWRFWDVLEPLCDRFELIAYSLPGHATPPSPPASTARTRLTAQLKALMQREGIAKFHLAGISMGGSLAQHFAGTHPEMVDR